MYKETIGVKNVAMYHMVKPNAASSYGPIDTTWVTTQSNNLRTAGENTPSFYKRKRRGDLLPFTRFLQLENKHISSECLIEAIRNSDGWQEKYFGLALYPESTGDVVSWTEASGIGVDKIDTGPIMQRAASQTRGDWDVLTFAAEMGQTVSMFINLLTKVTRLIRLRPPEVPWNAWLEARYGWRTLAFDMQDIEEAFSKATARKFSRASAGQSISWVTTSDPVSYTQADFVQTVYQTVRYELNCRGKIIVKGELPRFQVDFIKTAWEVTRLSFVVDWFVNIGNWIDSVQFVIGNREYTAGLGSQLNVESVAWRDFAPNPGYAMLSAKARVVKRATVQRRGPTSIPLVPQFSLNLNRWKIVDLLALLVQALWRK